MVVVGDGEVEQSLGLRGVLATFEDHVKDVGGGSNNSSTSIIFKYPWSSK